MFTVYSREISDVEPLHRINGATGLSLGMAVTMTAGSLEKCGATSVPTHIIMGDRNSDGTYPAIRVLPTTVFETTASATLASSNVGSKVTLGTDALTVTATTTSGVFTVDYTDGATSGGVVRGRFA